jgi:hypothetical protein
VGLSYRLPAVGQLGALVEDFRRDTGTSVSLLIEGTPRWHQLATHPADHGPAPPADAPACPGTSPQRPRRSPARATATAAAGHHKFHPAAGTRGKTTAARSCRTQDPKRRATLRAPSFLKISQQGQRCRQNPHQPDLRQDRRPRPRPGRPLRLPDRPGKPSHLTTPITPAGQPPQHDLATPLTQPRRSLATGLSGAERGSPEGTAGSTATSLDSRGPPEDSRAYRATCPRSNTRLRRSGGRTSRCDNEHAPVVKPQRRRRSWTGTIRLAGRVIEVAALLVSGCR